MIDSECLILKGTKAKLKLPLCHEKITLVKERDITTFGIKKSKQKLRKATDDPDHVTYKERRDRTTNSSTYKVQFHMEHVLAYNQSMYFLAYYFYIFNSN
ncbi:hypothetical protein RclHR1_00900015 [Rhizophagus clarus]|uniref:Uncharacterized protein n=1 Tax=Rhizophagus clarus TaxID=94130 RepID=A0A2Z6SPJ4_9GLOM|nr:hypothetical protein RclHR1_00900015 [Rhizophagus clarus]